MHNWLATLLVSINSWVSPIYTATWKFISPDQFNFLLLGSLQLKNGASDRKNEKNFKKVKVMGDWPDKIFNMKTTWKYKTKLPTSKLVELTWSFQIQKRGRKLYTERHSGPELHFHTAVSQLIRHDNFVNSGLLTNAMVLWHAQEEVTEGNSQRSEKNLGEETVRSSLDPDGLMNIWPWT